MFINKNVGLGGTWWRPVPQLWLKTCHYQGGEGRAKGLVTSFFHLLDLEEKGGG